MLLPSKQIQETEETVAERKKQNILLHFNIQLFHSTWQLEYSATKNTDTLPRMYTQHHSYEAPWNLMNKQETVLSVSTCSGPVVGWLVRGAIDEASQAGDSVRTHQDVAAKRSAVHHPDVERRVQEFVFWKVLMTKTHTQAKSVQFQVRFHVCQWMSYLKCNSPLQTIWPRCWSWGFSCSSGWGRIEHLFLHTLYPHVADPPELS